MGSSVPTIHRPERSLLEVSNSTDIPDALEQAYGASLRLKLNLHRNRQTPLRLARTAVGAFAIDEVDVPADIEASPDPLHKVIAVWVTRGQLTGRSGEVVAAATIGEITLVSQPDLPHESSAKDLTATSVLMDPALVASVSAGVPLSEAPLPLRFSDFAPVNPQAVRRWKETVGYVQKCVLADDAIATPLVLGQGVDPLISSVTAVSFRRPNGNRRTLWSAGVADCRRNPATPDPR